MLEGRAGLLEGCNHARRRLAREVDCAAIAAGRAAQIFSRL